MSCTLIRSKTFLSIFISLCVVISVLSIFHFNQEGRRRSTNEDSEADKVARQKEPVESEELTFAKSGLVLPQSRDLSSMFNFFYIIK